MSLQIIASVYDAMIQHAIEEDPLECCGLVLGTAARGLELFKLRNELARQDRYQAAPEDLLRSLRHMRQAKLDMTAIYHSHPHSPAVPSQVDLRENYYGLTPRIIISLSAKDPVLKAFRLYERSYEMIACERVPD